MRQVRSQGLPVSSAAGVAGVKRPGVPAQRQQRVGEEGPEAGKGLMRGTQTSLKSSKHRAGIIFRQAAMLHQH